jgi:ribosomal protein L35
MKTNKSYKKRLRVTRKGKVLHRKPGVNHFNAKESRGKQLERKRPQEFTERKKLKSYLPKT